MKRMRPIFSEWLRSIFLKRRWTVLTLTPFLVKGTQWLVNHFAPLPSNLHDASLFEAPWWLWVLCFSVCVGFAQFLGWREQFKLNREMASRPDVVARWGFSEEGGSRLFLRNASSRVAVNLSALDIIVPMPQVVRSNMQREAEAFVGQFEGGQPEQWFVNFGQIDNLTSDQGEQELQYKIQNRGRYQQDLAGILVEVVREDATANFALTIKFSNIVEPIGTWHAHYEGVYRYKNGIVSNFLGYGEVLNGRCSRCQ